MYRTMTTEMDNVDNNNNGHMNNSGVDTKNDNEKVNSLTTFHLRPIPLHNTQSAHPFANHTSSSYSTAALPCSRARQNKQTEKLPQAQTSSTIHCYGPSLRSVSSLLRAFLSGPSFEAQGGNRRRKKRAVSSLPHHPQIQA